MIRKDGHIFYMDPNLSTLKDQIYLLKSAKYHVVAAQTLINVAEVIRNEEKMALAVVDLKAGPLPGNVAPAEIHHVLVTPLREKFPNIPMLFIVGAQEGELIHEIKMIPNCDMIHPPYEPTYLLYMIKTGLAGGYLLSNL
ncbi:hypothetical protein K8S19_01130 [bacterium]|nr:hypothetical protein [bacterium]